MSENASSLQGIACVMVNYRAAGLVAAHLAETMAALRAVPGSGLFVVDNASPGDDAEILAEALSAYPDARLVAHDRNGGFAAGNNVGFAAAAAAEAERGRPFAYVCLLNPDAWPEQDAMARLAAFAEAHPRGGAFGPAIAGTDGALHGSAFRFPSVASEVETQAATGLVTRLLRARAVARPAPSAACRIGWVSGAAILMPRAVVREVGPMDEDYFLYFEETDYQLAITRAGYEVWYVPEARVTHVEGATTGQGKARRDDGAVPDYWYRSRRRYFEKNYGRAYADRADRAWLTATRFFVLRQKLLRRHDDGRAAAARRFQQNRGRQDRVLPTV